MRTDRKQVGWLASRTFRNEDGELEYQQKLINMAYVNVKEHLAQDYKVEPVYVDQKERRVQQDRRRAGVDNEWLRG